MILILIDNDHVRVMTVEIDTARCALSIFLLQDIYPLSESRSRSVPLYAGGGHPLIDFARASRRKFRIHIRIDFAIEVRRNSMSVP